MKILATALIALVTSAAFTVAEVPAVPISLSPEPESNGDWVFDNVDFGVAVVVAIFSAVVSAIASHFFALRQYTRDAKEKHDRAVGAILAEIRLNTLIMVRRIANARIRGAEDLARGKRAKGSRIFDPRTLERAIYIANAAELGRLPIKESEQIMNCYREFSVFVTRVERARETDTFGPNEFPVFIKGMGRLANRLNRPLKRLQRYAKRHAFEGLDERIGTVANEILEVTEPNLSKARLAQLAGKISCDQ